MKIQIITGDCREELRRFPDNHFQCCVTSPPYWGLRDYGVPPLVWGGDAACQHEWVRHYQPPKSGRNVAHEPRVRSNRAQQEMPNPMNDGVSSAFCLRCGAWRGSLGLEPAPDCGRPLLELRDDLTEEERIYVLLELKEAGLLE